MPLRAAALALSLIAAPALAQDQGQWRSILDPNASYRVTGISEGNRLNVRGGPGTGNAVVGKLLAGQGGLSLVECDAGAEWCLVNAGRGPMGWVATRFLEAVAVEPGTTGETVAATPTGGAIPGTLIGRWDLDAESCASTDSPTALALDRARLEDGGRGYGIDAITWTEGGMDLTATSEGVASRPVGFRIVAEGPNLLVKRTVGFARRLSRCTG